MTIADYLAARAARPTRATPKDQALAVMDLVCPAGQEIDGLLASAQRVKAGATVADAGAFEETVQTLGALSRQVWTAHDAALELARTWDQLTEVEARLAAAGFAKAESSLVGRDQAP